MSEPWNFTEAQRRQFREAHAEAKRKSIDELLDDRRRVRLAYFPVIPPGSNAGNALEAIVNEKLASLLAAKDGDNR